MRTYEVAGSIEGQIIGRLDRLNKEGRIGCLQELAAAALD